MAGEVLAYSSDVVISDCLTYFFGKFSVFAVKDIEEEVSCFLMLRHPPEYVFPAIYVFI